MIEFHRYFDRFAASLVRCLSEASFARKASESAIGQNAINGIRFSNPDLYLYFYLYSIHICFSTKNLIRNNNPPITCIHTADTFCIYNINISGMQTFLNQFFHKNCSVIAIAMRNHKLSF